jgi:hypothetical protein
VKRKLAPFAVRNGRAEWASRSSAFALAFEGAEVFQIAERCRTRSLEAGDNFSAFKHLSFWTPSALSAVAVS